MTIHTLNHTIDIATTAGNAPPDVPSTGLGSSTVWVRLDGGPWTRSIVVSLHKLAAMWCDVESVEVGWFRATGKTIPA